MTAKDFLGLLGSLMASRLPGNAAHLQRLAPAVAAGIPVRWLGPELAERAEPHMLDRMRLPELLAVLRREGELLAPQQAAPVTHRPSARVETPEQREAREEFEDREWWRDRLERLDAIADPTARWREVMGMAAVLNRPGAHPRPYLVGRIREILDEAEAEGADTDESRVARPPTRTADLAMPNPYQRRGIAAVPPASRTPAVARRVHPAVAAQQSAQRREDWFNRDLRMRAEAGDAYAAERLAWRTAQRQVVDQVPEMAQ